MQPFSLPRSQYIRPKDRAPSPPSSDDDVEMVPDSEGVRDEEPSVTNKRDSTRAIEDGSGGEDEGIEVHSETEATKGPMKTMAELAAEHAERERQLGHGSTRGSRPSRRIVRPLRAQRKLGPDESGSEPSTDDEEDLLEFTDDPSDPPPPRRRRAASSKTPSKATTRSSSKSTPSHRKKRPRSSDVEYDGSSRSEVTSAGRRPRRAMTGGTGELGPRTTRTVSNPSATSALVPASDRVLRSRKVRA